MSQDIRDFVTPSCDLLALGEPTHQEPAFARVRNELFAQLVDQGFRSIALETDRVPALAVDAHVQEGAGDFDEVMSEGIAFGRGELAPNRQLITWMREYNRTRPPAERLAFHGIDAEMENMSAPSPRRYLEHARAYLAREAGPVSPSLSPPTRPSTSRASPGTTNAGVVRRRSWTRPCPSAPRRRPRRSAASRTTCSPSSTPAHRN